MASTATNNTPQILNVRVTYALSLYLASCEKEGIREAYQRACKLAGLSMTERAQFRNAVSRTTAGAR